MEALKSYLLTGMLASLASSLLIRISDTRYRGYIRFVAGLAVLLVLTVPLASLAEELGTAISDIDFTVPSEELTENKEEVIGQLGRTMSRQIGDWVAERFSLSRESISVKLTLDLADLSAISIYSIEVTVLAECDEKKIEQYLSEALQCEGKITVIESTQ